MENRRMMMLIPALLLGVMSLLALSDDQTPAIGRDSCVPLAAYISSSLPVRDSIFILSDRYVSVSLKDQTATVIMRDDTNHVYNISTGNVEIFDGVATPTGIFTVQSKCPLAKSPQFNNAELHHWVGYYYNFGFHGLRSSRYYRYLGKSPSSHGCIRIGRDDAKSLYYKVKIGTRY